jgi:cephalosporin hydroxylase
MKIVIDTAACTLTRQEGESETALAETTVGLFTKEAFEALSREWIRVGWSLKYYHTFTWFGLPILQLPEDLLRLQEVIYAVRPALIVETGVFLGGSLLFHASLLEAMGMASSRVIGIDREIPRHVREAIERHPLHSRITLIEGDSTAPDVVAEVAGHVERLTGSGAPVLVILDSDHTRKHVARELECYSPFVTKESYIVATDGIMKDLSDVPRAKREWKSDNPFEAAKDFAERHPEFLQEQPRWLSHDSPLTENVTYWPGAWFKKLT